jgi:hypothetical protein
MREDGSVVGISLLCSWMREDGRAVGMSLSTLWLLTRMLNCVEDLIMRGKIVIVSAGHSSHIQLDRSAHLDQSISVACKCDTVITNPTAFGPSVCPQTLEYPVLKLSQTGGVGACAERACCRQKEHGFRSASICKRSALSSFDSPLYLQISIGRTYKPSWRHDAGPAFDCRSPC